MSDCQSLSDYFNTIFRILSEQKATKKRVNLEINDLSYEFFLIIGVLLICILIILVNL